MKPELERIRNRACDVEIHYVDQGLHVMPKRMVEVLQKKVQEVSYATRIVLGYGLCGNGIVGLSSNNKPLVVPRCHDCTALFLGSQAAYAKMLDARPGALFLTPGLLEQRKDPLSRFEEDYVPRVGHENAEWTIRTELKNYTHFILIDTGGTDIVVLRERTLENVAFFKKQYEEIHVKLEYFEKLLLGPYTDEDFFILGAGEKVTQDLFFQKYGKAPMLRE